MDLKIACGRVVFGQLLFLYFVMMIINVCKWTSISWTDFAHADHHINFTTVDISSLIADYLA